MPRSCAAPVSITVDESIPQQPRAKHLPIMLRCEPFARPAQGTAHLHRPAAVRLDSTEERVADVLAHALLAAGVTSSDVAAALDVNARRARRMLAGEHRIGVAHLVILVERDPRAVAAVRSMLASVLEQRATEK